MIKRTPKFKEFQVVQLIFDFRYIPIGTKGTILHIYENEFDFAYEVEFIDKSGQFIEETFAIKESFLTFCTEF